MAQIASQNAPSPSLVVPHFIFGGFTWLAAAGLISLFPEAFIGHYFNPKLLAIAHLLALGWITMVIFGALYQLIPVVMEVKLYSERLAAAAFVLLGLAAVLLAVMFWRFQLDALMHVSALLAITAVLLFSINVMATARRSTKKTVEQDFILTAVLWLVFTVAAGATLAFNLRHAFLSTPHLELLKLHAHAGIVGWFIQLIMGVGSRLLPMFMVSHGLDSRKLHLAYYAVNGGLLAGILALGLQWRPGVLAGIAGVVAGLLLFLSFLWEAYRKRVKKQLDIGMKQSALAFVLLLFPLVLVVVLSLPAGFLKNITVPAVIAYGAALLLGFITALIMGQTYKTLPFIVWLKVYRSLVGKGKTPLPRDLYSERAANIQLWAFAAGFSVLLAGILLQRPGLISAGGLLLLLSATFYNFNILKVVFKPYKKFKP